MSSYSWFLVAHGMSTYFLFVWYSWSYCEVHFYIINLKFWTHPWNVGGMHVLCSCCKIFIVLVSRVRGRATVCLVCGGWWLCVDLGESLLIVGLGLFLVIRVFLYGYRCYFVGKWAHVGASFCLDPLWASEWLLALELSACMSILFYINTHLIVTQAYTKHMI